MDSNIPQINGLAGPKPVAQIIITQMSEGQVLLQGPLHSKVLFYGLLEIARETVANYKPPESPIVPARLKLG